MNKNAQPDRPFRQPIEHDLPPGNWRALPTSTYQGASAFLLTSFKERILLSRDRQVRYQSFGAGEFLLEDGPMNRFEIGIKEDDSYYICSALSEKGCQQLLPNYRLLEARANIDGLCFTWIKKRDSGNEVLYAGSILTKCLADESDTFLLGDRTDALVQFSKIAALGKSVKAVARNRGNTFAAFWIPEDTRLPQAAAQGLPSEASPPVEKRRYLSYGPLKEGARPLEVWFDGKRIKVLALAGKELICLEESFERGGEALQRSLEADSRNLSIAKDKDDNVFVAWSAKKNPQPSGQMSYAPFTYANYLTFTKTSDLLSGETASVDIEMEGYASSAIIVIDEQERAYLVWKEERGSQTEVFSFSWQSGKKECLLSFSGKSQDFALSRDADEKVRGLCLLAEQKAFLFLPTNPSLPVEPEPSIKQPRTWANVYNGADQQTNHRGAIF